DQNLTDYLWMVENYHVVPSFQPKYTPLPSNIPSVEPGEMSKWILAFSENGRPSFEYGLQRWRETKSLPWLLVAIAKAQPGDKEAVELSAAAANVPADSPAYVTVTFHRLRLLDQPGRFAEARAQIDRILAHPNPKLALSARNQFL